MRLVSFLLLFGVLISMPSQAQIGNLFSGSDWEKLEVKVPIDKEFDLQKYGKIAIGDIINQSDSSSNLTRSISDQITEQLKELKDLKVLDRQYLQNTRGTQTGFQWFGRRIYG